MRTALIQHVCEACAQGIGPLEPLLLEVGHRALALPLALAPALTLTLTSGPEP